MDDIEEFNIPDDAIEQLRNPDVIRRYVAEGKTFQEIIGYDDNLMERFYGAASHLFNKQKYQEAADAFVFLTTLNPYVHNFWLGLGMAEQKNTEYEAALVAYGMAGMTDPNNPISLFYSSHCYYLMADYEGAVSMLDKVLERCGDDEELAELKTDAIAAREHMSRLKK